MHRYEDCNSLLWKVGMFPDVAGLQGIDDVSAVEEGSNSTWCMLDLVWAVCDQLLSKSLKTTAAVSLILWNASKGY